jgi:hypothetical protein
MLHLVGVRFFRQRYTVSRIPPLGASIGAAAGYGLSTFIERL